MRTNIVIDNDLMTKAMEISQLKTKREVVNMALSEYVSIRTKLNLANLRGKIKYAEGYDYKEARGATRDSD